MLPLGVPQYRVNPIAITGSQPPHNSKDMEKTPFKMAFLFILLVTTSDVPFSRIRNRANARGPFRCPRMIDCDSVCQGFPNCCVHGECICEKCPNETVMEAKVLDQKLSP
ncbi:hypothetical protein F0562_033056 [Nyssa sinensis]|uniref:Uncharacterized protein n=1 Tax=Nyssa sinensis TaxID=561372 RepID=A0A5J5ATT4_9ASTE|nr:hypothetical protein F0562_033056 [Nyssa sinensis]